MEAHDSDNETCNSDDFYTVVSDRESTDPVTVWGEDTDWVTENNKRSNEYADSVKNMQDSEKIHPR